MPLLTTLRTHLENVLNEYGLLVWSEDCDQQWAFLGANKPSGSINNGEFFSSWASFSSKELCYMELVTRIVAAA